jgi:hypothetical protein
MTDPKEKPRTGLRSPKPKKTLGLQVPHALRLPHDDLIPASEVEIERHPGPVAVPEPEPEPATPVVVEIVVPVATPTADVAPTPNVGVLELSTPTPNVGATPDVAPTRNVAATRKGPEPQRGVGATRNVAPTRGVGVRPSSLYYRMPNSIPDDLLPRLAPTEQLVYLQLYRLSWGHQRATCKISVPRLAERCNMGTTAVRTALRKLERDGHLTALGTDFGHSTRSERGLEYEVNLPTGTPTESVAPTRNVGATDSVAPTPDVAMKYIKENNRKESSKPDVYELRTIAARIFEVRKNEPNFSRDRLREAVRSVVIGENRDASDDLIDEAIRGMAL